MGVSGGGGGGGVLHDNGQQRHVHDSMRPIGLTVVLGLKIIKHRKQIFSHHSIWMSESPRNRQLTLRKVEFLTFCL